MGITKYGVWAFFKTEDEAKAFAKEITSFGNRYNILIMDKLKVMKGNSIRFFMSNKNICEEISWRIPCKYVFTMLGNKWKLDISNSEFTSEAECIVKELNKSEEGKARHSSQA